MDAIKLLTQDHRAVEALFTRFERTGKNAFGAKQAVTKQIIRELAIHTTIEELFLYPTARRISEQLRELALQALEEHHLAKSTLAELDRMKARDERYSAKVTVLMENIRQHIKEEEQQLFPKLRKAVSAAELNALGEAMAQAKKVAPTHPHPMAPDSPPGNFITHPLARILDAGRDLFGRKAKAAERKLGREADRAKRKASSSVRTLEAKARALTRQVTHPQRRRRSANGQVARPANGHAGHPAAQHASTVQ